MDADFGLDLKTLGQGRKAFHEAAREDPVAGKYVREAAAEQPSEQAGEQSVAEDMAAPIRPRHFMLASADDHVELLLDQHPHHVRRGRDRM